MGSHYHTVQNHPFQLLTPLLPSETSYFHFLTCHCPLNPLTSGSGLSTSHEAVTEITRGLGITKPSRCVLFRFSSKGTTLPAGKCHRQGSAPGLSEPQPVFLAAL